MFLIMRENTGRVGSVGIAILYGLGGSRIESQLGRHFLHPSRPAMGPFHPPIQWVSGPVPGGRAVGAWR